MCIAIVKLPGINFPSKKTLKICWYNNPDGAGILFQQGNKVVVDKGHMTFKNFWKAFQSHKLTKNDFVALHFRYATSGGFTPEKTHPFPISAREKELNKTKFKSDFALLHNGVLGEGEKNLSDTQVFIRDIVSNVKPYLNDIKIQKMLENLSVGSRLAIFHNGNYFLTGNWIDENGLLFSKNEYKRKKKSKLEKQCIAEKCNYDYDTLYEYSNEVRFDDICPFCGNPVDYTIEFCPLCGLTENGLTKKEIKNLESSIWDFKN